MLLSLIFLLGLSEPAKVSLPETLHGVSMSGVLNFVDLSAIDWGSRTALEQSSISVVPIVNAKQNFLAISSKADNWLFYVPGSRPVSYPSFVYSENILSPKSPLYLANWKVVETQKSLASELFYRSPHPKNRYLRCYFWKYKAGIDIAAEGSLVTGDSKPVAVFKVQTDAPAQRTWSHTLSANQIVALTRAEFESAKFAWDSSLNCDFSDSVVWKDLPAKD